MEEAGVTVADNGHVGGASYDGGWMVGLATGGGMLERVEVAMIRREDELGFVVGRGVYLYWIGRMIWAIDFSSDGLKSD